MLQRTRVVSQHPHRLGWKFVTVTLDLREPDASGPLTSTGSHTHRHKHIIKSKIKIKKKNKSIYSETDISLRGGSYTF